MNTEQLRAEFEAWTDNHYYLSELNNIYLDDDYVDPEMQAAWEGYQAGRAALQSQDREDAERYRWIAKQKDVWVVLGDEYNLASEYEGANNLTEAIDHARRIEENK